jgi:hypothetical protein
MPNNDASPYFRQVFKERISENFVASMMNELAISRP